MEPQLKKKMSFETNVKVNEYSPLSANNSPTSPPKYSNPHPNNSDTPHRRPHHRPLKKPKPRWYYPLLIVTYVVCLAFGFIHGIHWIILALISYFGIPKGDHRSFSPFTRQCVCHTLFYICKHHHFAPQNKLSHPLKLPQLSPSKRHTHIPSKKIM